MKAVKKKTYAKYAVSFLTAALEEDLRMLKCQRDNLTSAGMPVEKMFEFEKKPGFNIPSFSPFRVH